MFIATSSVPMQAPNTASVSARLAGVSASARNGITSANTSVPATMTRRQPKRLAISPVTGMATIEPSPRHSSSRPKTASSTSARAFANGTSGAQAAIATPGIRNVARVAHCSRGPVRGRFTGAGAEEGLSPLLHALGFDPQRFQLFERLLAFAAGLLEPAFDVLEARCELRIRAAQRLFGIDADLAREIGHHEKDVAHLLGHRLEIGLAARFLQLSQFLVEFLQDLVSCRPIEI